MLKFIKSFFTKPEAKVEAPVAEYKVEAPATVEIVPAGTEASVAAPAKAKKAPASKKAPAAKKPRAPRKPKPV
jgi:hypothetical protein